MAGHTCSGLLPRVLIGPALPNASWAISSNKQTGWKGGRPERGAAAAAARPRRLPGKCFLGITVLDEPLRSHLLVHR